MTFARRAATSSSTFPRPRRCEVRALQQPDDGLDVGRPKVLVHERRTRPKVVVVVTAGLLSCLGAAPRGTPVRLPPA